MEEERFGRRLESILEDAKYTKRPAEVSKVSVSLIKPNPYQARIEYKEEEILQLAESIKRNGLLEPILVRKKDNYYEIIAGERRFMAIQKLGLPDVEVKILNVNDAKLCEISLIENLERKDLNPIERANGYRKLIDLFGYSQEEIARIFNVSPAVVSNALRLLSLPTEIKEYFSRENFTEGHARVLLSIKDTSKQLELAKRVIEENLSVRQLEDLILKNSLKQSKIQKFKKSQLPLELQEVQVKLSNSYNTKVKINYNSKTKTGYIQIKFFDEKHLNEILEKLLKN